MVREILGRMTSAGRRMMSISIAAFSIYALSSVAMAFVVLAAIHSVLAGPADLVPCWVALICLLLVKGASGIVADKQKHCAGFDLVLEIRIAATMKSAAILVQRCPTTISMLSMSLWTMSPISPRRSPV